MLQLLVMYLEKEEIFILPTYRWFEIVSDNLHSLAYC